MKTQKFNMGWWMATKTCAMLVWFGLAASVSGQCFDDNKGTKAKPSTDSVVNGSIDFALALFKSVAKPPSLPQSGNCHVSPLSVRVALIITHLGAKGTTKTEMQTALRLGKTDQEQALEQYRQYKSVMVHNATESANYTVRIADKLYFDNGVQLRECIAEYLRPELEKANFRSAPDQAREGINQWVEEVTNNRIPNLLPPGSIDSYTTMVIVNALYFKATWDRTFSPQATYDDYFFVEPQSSKKVSMMHQLARFPHSSSSQLDCTAVELPYSGNDLSMVILLPNSNVQDLVNKLSSKNLKDLLGKLSPVTVRLTLPKFKITQTFELTPNLQSLGIRDLFDSTKADLSGFTGERNVFVTSVHHKTFIEVNEDGTEAAAATAIVVGTTSVIVEDALFNANHPFVFIIRHVRLNSVLFIGLIKDPSVQD